MSTKVSLPRATELVHLFNLSAWQRGQAYARSGAVLWSDILTEPDAPDSDFQICGETEGSQSEPYEQDIHLWRPDKSRWKVVGDCTCPMSFNCKHVVAVLVDALGKDWFSSDEPLWPLGLIDAKPSVHEPLNRWLAQTESQLAAEAPPLALAPSQQASLSRLAAQAEFDHLVVLDVCHLPNRSGRWLTLWPGKARWLKNKPGELGKVSQPSIYAGSTLSPYDGQGRVFELLRRWHAGQASGAVWRTNDSAPVLPQQAVRDEVGAVVLEQAARAGELVLLTPDRLILQRIRWGETCRLDWAWSPTGGADGAEPQWQLAPDLGSPSAELFMGEPMLYIDRQAGVCGRVDAQAVDVKTAQRWLAVPAMQEAWMREQSLRLAKLLPPLPEAVRGEVLRDIRGVAPTPCLSIHAHPQPKEAVFQIELAFDYDGISGVWVAHDPDLQAIDTPEGKVHLWRDVMAEFDAMAHLMTAGYRALVPTQPTWWQAQPGDRPSPHERDLALLDDDFAEWREAGWHIEVDEALQAGLMRDGVLDLALQGQYPDATEADNDWFSLSLGFSVDGQRFNLLPWLPQLIGRWSNWEAQSQQGKPWPLHTWLTDESGQPWRVPTEPLRPWLGALMELTQERGRSLAGDALKLDRFEALRLASVEAAPGQQALGLSAGDANSLAGLVSVLKQPDGLPMVAPPEGLQAQMRPYQQQGLSWLQLLRQHRLGGVLADDMGLGKTLQTIAHLLLEKQAGRLTAPALIVAPTSLVGNWRSELQRFAPTLSALVLHGQHRHNAFTRLADHDVVITTYPLLLRDEEVLTKQTWSTVVLDEAQAIKNSKTRLAAIVIELRAKQRLCLTGTPMENHLGEVWSLFHFLMPGYLGHETRFKQLFRTPIEKHGDTQRLALLRARLQPFMLRRTKAAVATELPPKIEAIEHIELQPAQANLYEVIRVATEAKVREALQSKGLARSQIAVLDALLKLRQVCCDPQLVPLEAAKKVKASAKMDWLMENLPAMIEDGRRVLVFSQFTSMLTLIEKALAKTSLTWVKLTGQSQKREDIVARFTSGEVPLFLISLKAGGVGLNLPQADTVIHVDPWWNPAAEDQATDRAHRLGQQSTVFVYKLVAQGTLEERIVAMQERKAALAQGLHGDALAGATRLTEGELDWLLQPIGMVAKQGELARLG
ncbi:DEAD/DEAH box helicase [Aquabacterium sp.]|uniref:DEAD/DEAH box helicase n=1 Tax=Aquabacterium sp. TaxID=1872578 RepID=UPI0024889384|nr:DEAD/DEAH box helicase [Aquabacterium sp.]MDI1259221.1 DEAD/DEAH box helicase [Aquabacterium sp.]